MIIETGATYYAVEPNSHMAKLARGIGAKEVKEKMSPPIPYADNTFDVLYYADVFEHMNDFKMTVEMIKESKRVLKPKGVLVIIAPEYPNWGEDFYNCDYTHNNPTSLRRTAQIFDNYGIKVLQTNQFSGPFGKPLSLITGEFASLVNAYLFNILTLGLLGRSKWYKLKLNYLKRFLIVGENE